MSTFQVERRPEDGPAAKKLRKAGVLPMALIQREHSTVMLQAPSDRFREALKHVDGHGTLVLQIGTERRPRKAIVKQIDQDALRNQLIHVTLQEVSDEDQVKMDVPILVVAHSEEEGNGATLSQVMDTLKVRGRLMDIPDHIEVDASKLSAGEHLEVSQLSLPESVEVLSAADATVITLTINRAVELPETASEDATEGEQLGGESAS